jgi:hypothetical protein
MALGKLQNGKAGSPLDEVGNELLKYGGGGMHDMLLAFFKLQWDLEFRHRTTGVIRELHKGHGKDKTHVESYRPVQLLSCIDKLYDCILNNRIMPYLTANSLLHTAQNGFVPGRDCLEHLLTLHSVVSQRSEQGKDTYVFFADQCKAYDTAWRNALIHKLWGKGIQGKMFRVICDLLQRTTARVSHGGVMSEEFEVYQGFEQGGTLSPTLFDIYIDELLEDVWSNCPGVPILSPGGTQSKLPALMFADDFAGLAESEADLQKLVDRTHNYYNTWRMKANVCKCAVMVFKGKQRGGRRRAAAPTNIRWGGPSGTRIPEVEQYTYMGVVLHNTCEWGAQLQRATEKVVEKANQLTTALRNRGISGDVKCMLLGALARPTMEWGGGVWHPNAIGMKSVDSAFMQLCKSAFHCPPFTSHSALMQELGIRPMSTWFDKRMLEMWHRICKMDDTRIVKQVMFGSVGSGAEAERRPGRRKATWMDKVHSVMQTWEIDEAAAENLTYHQFKNLLSKKLPHVVEKRLRAEEVDSPVLRNYRTYFGDDQLQFKKPQRFLCGGPCSRGKELVIQLRTQSLPLASLTGKFGRRRKDNPDDPAHFTCPVCSNASETVPHFMLECEGYHGFRQTLFTDLDNAAPEKWNQFKVLTVAEQAFCMLCDKSWGDESSIVADHIAPFVYNCWQHRISVLRALPPQGAVTDGSNAMV